MPIATTYDAIRASIVTTIRGITPTYAPDSGKLWRTVYGLSEVPSQDIRNYYVDLGVPIEEGEIYGGCALHAAEMNVWTSYGGMNPSEAQVMVARDHQDLWRELHRAQIDGAPKFEKGGFEPEYDDGHLWGAHVFTAFLFLPLPEFAA